MTASEGDEESLLKRGLPFPGHFILQQGLPGLRSTQFSLYHPCQMGCNRVAGEMCRAERAKSRREYTAFEHGNCVDTSTSLVSYLH